MGSPLCRSLLVAALLWPSVGCKLAGGRVRPAVLHPIGPPPRDPDPMRPPEPILWSSHDYAEHRAELRGADPLPAEVEAAERLVAVALAFLAGGVLPLIEIYWEW